MKNRIYLYILLLSIFALYSCQNDVKEPTQEQKEQTTSLLLEAKSFFKLSLKKAIYTRGVQDVYGESKKIEFIPTNFTPLWNEAKIIEKPTEIDVFIPILTFDKFNLCDIDGKENSISQMLVYRKKLAKSDYFILSICSTNGQESSKLIDNFAKNIKDIFFTGIAWYLTLDGNVELIEAYEDGQRVCDTRSGEGTELLNTFYLKDALIMKTNTSTYSSNEGDDGGSGRPSTETCPRCCVLKIFCQCCIHYPNPTKKSQCTKCRTTPETPIRCKVCGNLLEWCTCKPNPDKPPVFVRCQNCASSVRYGQACPECGYKNKY